MTRSSSFYARRLRKARIRQAAAQAPQPEPQETPKSKPSKSK